MPVCNQFIIIALHWPCWNEFCVIANCLGGYWSFPGQCVYVVAMLDGGPEIGSILFVLSTTTAFIATGHSDDLLAFCLASVAPRFSRVVTVASLTILVG